MEGEEPAQQIAAKYCRAVTCQLQNPSAAEILWRLLYYTVV
jgi:hypothetical protein